MLYLIPNHLGNTDTEQLPSYISFVINKCDVLFVENLKTIRAYLKLLKVPKAIDDFTWVLINKDTTEETLNNQIPLLQKYTCAFISEAGLPAIADPGAKLVSRAHKLNIEIVPLIGPSSLMMALMCSGFNGQNFAFNGYLPIKSDEKLAQIKQLENLVIKKNQTQIFIETPYRNNQLLQDLINTCSPHTLLCIAVDISLSTESVKTKTILQWKQNIPELHKRPAVFLLGNF